MKLLDSLLSKAGLDEVPAVFLDKLTEYAKPQTLFVKGEFGVAETVLANLAKKSGVNYDKIEIDDLAADATDLALTVMEVEQKATSFVKKLETYAS